MNTKKKERRHAAISVKWSSFFRHNLLLILFYFCVVRHHAVVGNSWVVLAYWKRSLFLVQTALFMHTLASEPTDQKCLIKKVFFILKNKTKKLCIVVSCVVFFFFYPRTLKINAILAEIDSWSVSWYLCYAELLNLWLWHNVQIFQCCLHVACSIYLHIDYASASLFFFFIQYHCRHQRHCGKITALILSQLWFY